MGDFTMPSLGADMLAGKVTRWLVKPGDRVHRGDIVAVVQTDKSDIEVEIFEDGTMGEILVPAGDRVSVGTVLAHVNGEASEFRGPVEISGETAALGPSSLTAVPQFEPGATSIAPSPPQPRLEAVATSVRASLHPGLVESPLVRSLAERLGVEVSTMVGSGVGGVITRRDVEHASNARVRPSSSPLARRMATELGIELSSLVGTGPHGAIIERDVGREQREPPPETPPIESDIRERRLAMQRAVGALMARSKREVPHYYLTATIDLSRATSWLDEANRSRPPATRLLMAALYFRATALAVKHVPEMNGLYVGETFTASERVHLGVAISQRTGGLIAPAIHDVDQISLEEVMARTRDLVRRARNGVLRASEMSDPTLTVTNLGDLGVDSVFGVIYPPQVALVGFGRVREQPWAKDGLLTVRPCVIASLSGDHRVSDGMRGARFLSEIDRLLQEPESL